MFAAARRGGVLPGATTPPPYTQTDERAPLQRLAAWLAPSAGPSTSSPPWSAASDELSRAIEDMFADRCTQYAAAIAYRVLFSLFPLTIALVSVFGLVLQDDELRQQVIDELMRPPGLHVGPGQHPGSRSSRSPRHSRRSA